MRLIDADVLLDKTIRRNSVWKGITNSEGKNLEEIVSELPPVNPQEPKTDEENIHREREQAYMQGYEDACKKYRQEPKTGHWIAIDEEPHEDYECDKCGYTIWAYNANIEPNTEYKYCPNCGCRMFEPQESEVTDADSD